MANPDPVTYENLLCEHCKQAVVLARAAQEALEKLRAHTNGVAVLPTLPAEATPAAEPLPWEGRPGKELSREERLAKARHLIKQPEAHKTSNGTVIAEPWRVLPRKKIRASAEKDLQRVVSGKMSQIEWVARHKYSRALLTKRLAMLGVVPHKPGRGVSPTYTPPRHALTEQEMMRVVNGEISGNQLAIKKEMPVGTVYRLVQSFAKSRRLRIAPLRNHKAAPRDSAMPKRKTQFSIEESDIDRYIAGTATREGLVKKYGCSNALIWYYASRRAKVRGLKYDARSRTWHPKPEKGRQVPMFDNGESEPKAESEPEPEPEPEARNDVEGVYDRINEAMQ